MISIVFDGPNHKALYYKHESMIAQLQLDLDQSKQSLQDALEREINIRRTNETLLQNLLSLSQTKFQTSNDILKEKDILCQKLEKQIIELKDQLNDLQKQIKSQDNKLQQQKDEYESFINFQKQQINQLQNVIKELENKTKYASKSDQDQLEQSHINIINEKVNQNEQQYQQLLQEQKEEQEKHIECLKQSYQNNFNQLQQQKFNYFLQQKQNEFQMIQKQLYELNDLIWCHSNQSQSNQQIPTQVDF